MKQIILNLALAACALSAAAADPVSDINVERSESNLIVNMTVDPQQVTSRSNREEWLRPVITNGVDSLRLRPVIVAGRTRYYQHLRADGNNAPYVMLRSGKGDPYAYSEVVPYADWMEMSTLTLERDVDGCCGDALEASSSSELARLDFTPQTFEPLMVYVKPAAEAVKTREIHGSAYIDFRVNRTDIDPGYRRNPEELAAIRATIDAIKGDKDVTITSLSIKGYASPEGPYANNERLAKGRTEALVDYVRNLYSFPAGLMTTSWEAEDWQGLVDYVKKSTLADRDDILALITDNSLAPDAREWRLKSRFPEQYAFLLKEVYPALRHSDYAVNYNIRNYTTVEEIAAVMASAPQKLSLEELFRLAQSLDKDSPEFQEVMEVAVRMYPDSPVANLNAGLTAIGHDELDMARAYLAKAGKSPEADYARGILEAKAGNYTRAVELLQAAKGVAEAQAAIDRLHELKLID
jgi:hypothetical protein